VIFLAGSLSENGFCSHFMTVKMAHASSKIINAGVLLIHEVNFNQFQWHIQCVRAQGQHFSTPYNTCIDFMERYFTCIRKILQRMAMSHAALLAGWQ
jgi:hypothetical protein